jgi:hypothetical protein
MRAQRIFQALESARAGAGVTLQRTAGWGSRVLVLAALGLGIAASPSGVQTRAGQTVDFGPAPPPLSRPVAQRLMANPGLLSEAKKQWPHGSSEIALAPRSDEAAPPTGGTWTSGNRPSGDPSLSNPLLLTDGTVIAHVSCTGTWWKLTPDNTGSYVNGTWSQIASLPFGYTPRFFGSAVLTDGGVVVEGGEYNTGCGSQWTNLGAIYDPVANSWTSISPPSGWMTIGDAQSIVLSNGTYMLANCCTTQAALLNEGSLTWSNTGTGKFDVYDEEGWTLLPNGKVLTVDAYVFTRSCGQGSEIYDPSTGAWSSAGNVGLQLADCSNPGNNPSFEMGPQVQRPDGTVVAFAGTLCSDGPNSSCASGALSITSHTAIFNTGSNTWGAGPDLPAVSGRNYTLADAPAALLPNGNILFAASPNYQGFVTPTHFFEFDTSNTIAQVADPTDAASFTSYQWNFLVLPSGQIMAVQTDGPNVWYYTPSGGPCSGCAPAISSLSSTTLSPGQTYQISGTQLNGLSEGANYGDDVQGASNYPIITITNNATGHVFFTRTGGFSNRSIAPNASSTAFFYVPAAIETGISSLVVIANGIASQPVCVSVGSGSCPSSTDSLSVSLLGPGTVTSSPPGISCPGTCKANFAAGSSVALSEVPASGWNFLRWDGACFGPGGCAVTMTSNQSVMATFWTDGGSGTGASAIASAPGASAIPSAPLPAPSMP